MNTISHTLTVAWKEIQLLAKDRGALSVLFLLPLLFSSLYGSINIQTAGGGDAIISLDICLVNQGYLCIGTSTRGGCRALCTRPGHPCVGCRGPSDAFIEKESGAWFASVQRVVAHMTDIPADEIEAALRSPQLALFLFQFADYAGTGQSPRLKEQVL